MSGVNGADHTPFKSGGAAGSGLPDAARLPHAVTKGTTSNNKAAQTVEPRKQFFTLGLGSTFCTLSLYFFPSAAPAEP
jgi:hypothetical protein